MVRVCFYPRFEIFTGVKVQIAVLGYDVVWTRKSPTAREEHKLRAFENRVMTIIFGPNGEKLTRGWRKSDT
jgi:hypothetical protein